MNTIYLDNNATTALDPEVLEAMRPFWLSAANPESRHALGRAARRALEQAKESVGRILGAEPSEIIFTSGGTEANNLAVFGLARGGHESGHLISSPIEHPAVAEPIKRLEASGFSVNRPDVDTQGVAGAEQMAEAVQLNTRLITLMLANNETGALQPVAELAALAQERGVPVHSDAVQAVGRIPVNFHALGVTTLAASAHKFHGPSGVGLLLVRKGVQLRGNFFGGAQQEDRRPRTAAVALAIGFAAALERWSAAAEVRAAHWQLLSQRLEAGLISALGSHRVIRNGPREPSQRLPQTVNLGFPGVNGDALLMQLDLAGVAASLGAACASRSTQPSPTLIAMHVPDDRLRSSVRFSFGAFTTKDEIDAALPRIIQAVERVA